MQGYDIIGDIHGCAGKLRSLLDELGYRRNAAGVYEHDGRQAVFVGDLVDRGDEQLEVLKTVKDMVDAGTAQLVMGNHEFNAIGFSIEHPPGSGQFLRPHSDKNIHQHRIFLEQVTGSERDHYLEWFKTIPLWLDLGGTRVIHACWHSASMKIVERELDSHQFTSLAQIVRANDKRDPLYTAVEILLKGPEVNLGQFGQPAYSDKDGHSRGDARVCWWNAGATTLREVAVMDPSWTTTDGEPYPELPETEVSAEVRSYVYNESVPVFYGHYWRKGRPKYGVDWTDHSACVDFSAVKGGDLTVYRWSGEKTLRAENFVPEATS